MIIWTDRTIPGPKWGEYFNDDQLVGPFAYVLTTSSDGLTTEFDSGTAIGAIGQAHYICGESLGSQGRWLAIFKVSIPYNGTTNSSINVGFGNIIDAEPHPTEIAVGYLLARTSGGLAVYHIAAHIDATHDVNGVDLVGTIGSPPTDYYVAVAIDLDTGEGELVSSLGSFPVSGITNFGEAGGTVGSGMAGASVLMYLGIAMTNGAASAQDVTVQLVKSSASHGLTLPSDYTNIVPEE